MGRKYIKLLLALTVVLNFMGLQAGYAQTDLLPPDDGPPGIQIVGGEPAQPGAWPWQALILIWDQTQNVTWMCGGSLIDVNYVLTAAHCVFGYTANQVSVVLGEHHRTEPDGTEQTHAVSQIIVHQNYDDDTLDNDIALLRLNAPATLNSRVRLVSLLVTPQHDSLFKPGTIATTTGWGTTDDGKTSDVLRQVNVPIVSNDTCNEPASHDGRITANMVCAGRSEGGVGSCGGDSGGPLVVPNGVGGWLLGGIVSWGPKPCGMPNKYGVYTRVANYHAWITSITGLLPGRQWFLDYAQNGFGAWDASYPNYGGSEAHPVPADYDGDGRADLSVKTDDGRWLIDYASNGFGSWNATYPSYGGPSAHPVPADYDGDGKADLSVKTDDGRWLIDYAVNGFGSWNASYRGYGGADAHPVPADYDGDRKAELSVKADN